MVSKQYFEITIDDLQFSVMTSLLIFFGLCGFCIGVIGIVGGCAAGHLWGRIILFVVSENRWM